MWVVSPNCVGIPARLAGNDCPAQVSGGFYQAARFIRCLLQLPTRNGETTQVVRAAFIHVENLTMVWYTDKCQAMVGRHVLMGV